MEPRSFPRLLLLPILLCALVVVWHLPAAAQACCYPEDEEACRQVGGIWKPLTCDCINSPIIIDTDGRGIHLTDAAGGALFDLNSDGIRERLAWTQASSSNAFLVLDRNQNRTIDNGTELFGNFTPQPDSMNKNGFLALAEFDKPDNGGNADGVLDAQDPVFAHLRLWIDSNHNGISEPNELFLLPYFGINSISLDYHEFRRSDEFGNIFRYRAKLNVGQHGGLDIPGRWAYDVFLVAERSASPSEAQSGNLRKTIDGSLGSLQTGEGSVTNANEVTSSCGTYDTGRCLKDSGNDQKSGCHYNCYSTGAEVSVPTEFTFYFSRSRAECSNWACPNHVSVRKLVGIDWSFLAEIYESDPPGVCP